MPRRVVLDQIEVRTTGDIGVRLLKQVVESEEVLFSEPHRTVVGADVAVADQMAAVNTHLEAMGYPPLSAAELARIEAHAALARG